MAKWVVDDYYGVAENNYGSFATGGVYAIISRFRELTVYDSWLEATRVENSRLIAIFTLEDGTSVELASGYTHTLIGTLYTPLHIYTTINNSDLPFSDEDISQMAKMIKTFCYTMAPVLCRLTGAMTRHIQINM